MKFLGYYYAKVGKKQKRLRRSFCCGFLFF